MQLQYMGFEQAENIRKYIFHRIAHGEETKVFEVSTDLALFRRNHVGLQEGPALCLRMLTGNLETLESPLQPLLRHTLTDQHIQAYLVTRGIPTTKKHSPKPPIPIKTSLAW